VPSLFSGEQKGKIGMRWRTQQEVVTGKGQFVCGAKGCEEREHLASFEVNFAYEEGGEARQALVKLRVCPQHALQLSYRKDKAVLKVDGFLPLWVDQADGFLPQ
jgi:Folate-sensitive fragile site protein Fra10Ac1